MKIAILAIAIWLMNVAHARTFIPANDPNLTLQVEPTSCLAPCDLKITLNATKKFDNRWISVEVDGPTMVGSITKIDGLSGPTEFIYNFTKMPQGNYVVKAMLFDSKREISRKTTRLSIQGK